MDLPSVIDGGRDETEEKQSACNIKTKLTKNYRDSVNKYCY